MPLSHPENQAREVTLYLIHTSDIHGNLFGYDYLKKRNMPGGLDCIYSYVNLMRHSHPNAVILTDGGDFLQGQPLTYYYNYIQTEEPHIVVQAMNNLEYDCAVIGNHDLETGHEVYDRVVKELAFPILGANVILSASNQPYFAPYHITERQGVRVAILGLTSDAVPGWLSQELWKGLYFENMVDSARYWVDYIQKHEKPHLIIGLFHSGLEGGMKTDPFSENISKELVSLVDGLDLVLYGHDHMPCISGEISPSGKTILMLNPSSFGLRVAVAEIKLRVSNEKILSKRIHASLPKMSFFKSLNEQILQQNFNQQIKVVEDWLKTPIGELTTELRESDAYFGPNMFVSLLHQMQLEISGAQISFAAPLNYDTTITKGQLTIQDMFRLYKFENFLCVVRMKGAEVHDFLELSYSRWTNTMNGPNDHLLLLTNNLEGGKRMGLMNLAYNFDSADGIEYMVDVSKQDGNKITIHRMSDGSDFDMDAYYSVVMSSYRANGGGELMTLGAGISHHELHNRILSSTVKDMRFYFIEFVKKHLIITPNRRRNWQFVPREWTECALKRDHLLLFEEEKI